MATQVPPKKNAAYTMYVSLASQASTHIMQANPTLAAGDVKVSTDGGALGNLATLPVVTPAASKLVQVDLSASEMNGDNVTIIFSDAAGAEWDDLVINLQTSARQIDDLATPTNITAGTITTVTNLTTNNDKTGYSLTAGEHTNIAADTQTGMTAQGYTTTRAGYLDTLNGLVAAIWASVTRTLTAGTNIVLAKGVGITGFNDLSAAQVNAEVLDVLTVDTFAEVTSAPAATSTLKDKIGWLFKLARNKRTTTSTTDSVFNDAGNVADSTSTISDDGTTFTRGEYT